MSEFFASYGWILLVIVGIIISTLGGLLSLTPDPERPGVFVPVYALALVMFIAGMGVIVRCSALAEDISWYLS